MNLFKPLSNSSNFMMSRSLDEFMQTLKRIVKSVSIHFEDLEVKDGIAHVL